MTSDPPLRPEIADLRATLDLPTAGDGVHWTLDASTDLNANLVRLGPDGAIGDHLNSEVDVLIVVVAGGGELFVDGTRSPLAPNVVAHVPRGTHRSVTAAEGGLAYLTVHRRRGGLGLGPTRGGRATAATGEILADEGGDAACWAHHFTDD